MRRHLTLVLLTLLAGSPARAPAEGARVILHVQPARASLSCEGAARLPCNPGTSTAVLSVPTGADYDVYLIVGGAYSSLGSTAVGYTLDYDDAPYAGIDIVSHTSCGESTVDPEFPAPGSACEDRWSCDSSPAPGDENGNVTHVAHVFRIHAYSKDRLAVRGRPPSHKIEISFCRGGPVGFSPIRTGAVAVFGSDRGAYDPCNPYTPIGFFAELAPADLESTMVQIQGGWSTRSGDLALYGSRTPLDVSWFPPFESLRRLSPKFCSTRRTQGRSRSSPPCSTAWWR